MNLSLYIKPEGLHHAYGVSGDREKTISSILSFIEKEIGRETKGNPDFFLKEYETFGIEEGRKISELHSTKPFGDKKFFVLIFDFITLEAQNSLLKLFEEPNPNNHFFIVVPSHEIFLPTLRSRLFLLDLGREALMEEKFAKSFLKANQAERGKIVKEIAEEKDKTKALDFLSALETEIFLQENRSEDLNFALEEIIRARDYMGGRSPSIKMLLEHIASVLP